MQKILLFALLIVCLTSEAQDVDVLHYKFEIGLSDKSDTIYGKATIDLKFVNPTDTVLLDLKSLEKVGGKGMLVYSNIDSSQPFIGKSLPSDKVALLLLKTPKKGATWKVTLEYKGIPADGLIISKNKYGDRTFFADNWPNRAHHWIPCVDRPVDKASFEFLVTAPAHYDVISNGLKVEEKQLGNGNKLTHWRETTPLPTKVMVIGAARFATKTYDNSPKGIPVSAWVYPQDSIKGFYDYALAPDILQFFSEYIAPFPYKKLANVQSKTIFGGMENASAIFYAESSVTGDRSSEDLLAHEIAHQWFGDMASEKTFAHLWLSEGFATFLTNYYFEKKYGKETAAKRWKENRDEVIAFARQNPRQVVDSTSDLMSLLNANSYQKGAWVLHMLRSEVGDSTFRKIIQTYYNQYKGSNAETRDFEAVAEKVSGRELTWFFDQWLYNGGIPKLSIAKEITDKGTQLTIEQHQKNLYQLSLPMEIKFANRGIVTFIKINKRIETFLVSHDKGGTVIIDPDFTVLYEQVKK